MNRTLSVFCLLASLFSAQPAWSQPTSENNARLKKGLKDYPEADTDGDGILTLKEARVFLKKAAGEEKKSSGGSGDSDKAIEVPKEELDRDDLEKFEPEESGGKGIKMLFIGHSLVAPVESHFRKRVAPGAGLEGYESRMQYSGGKTGAPLRHWNYTGGKQKTRPALMTGKWDCLAMGMYYYWSEVEDISRWIDFALKYNPAMKFYLQDGWPAADGGGSNYGGSSREAKALREAAGEIWKDVDKDDRGRKVLRFEAFEKAITALDKGMDVKLKALDKKYPGKVFSIRSSHAMLELRRLLEKKKKIPLVNRVLASSKRDRSGALYADQLHSGPAVIQLEGYLYLAAVHKRDPRKLPAIGKGEEARLDRLLRELAVKITVENPWSGVKKASDLK
ncbi:MAG: hypothetical protein NZ935_05450 [Planctomycetes bacterium]|nr:hypothetical protein [Planctomycetota bacterium]